MAAVNLLGVLFQPGADNAGGFFKKAAVGLGEGGGGVAVDVDFADDMAMRADGDDDL